MDEKKEKCCGKGGHNHAGSGAVYGLGLIGALVYYLQHVTTFEAGVMGVLKALVWPALLIYKVFGLLGM